MAKRVKFFALLNSDAYKPKPPETQPLLRSPSTNDLLTDAQKYKIKSILQNIEGKDELRDRVLRTRHIAMLVNTLICVTLSIIMLQLEWDGHKLRETSATYGIKIAIMILTLIQLAQICEAYWRELTIGSERSKETATVMRTRAILKSPMNPNFSKIDKTKKTSYFTVLRTTDILRKFLLEMLVTIPCPVPFFPISLTKEGGLLIFLRLYIVLIVLKDFSTIFRKRKIIERIPGYSHGTHPSFNTFLALKMIFYKRPVGFVCSVMLVIWLVLAYAVYIYEREAQPGVWNYWISLYLGFNCLFTGWGDDTFAKYSPVTWVSKIMCLVAVVIGVFWFALLIDYVHSKMQPTRFQLTALEWLARSSIIEKERDTSARLIQLLWRHHNWKRKAKQLGLSKAEKKDESENFSCNYLKLLKTARKLRRDKQKNAAPSISAPQTSQSQSNVTKAWIEQSLNDLHAAMNRDFAQMLEEQKRQILQELKNGEPPPQIRQSCIRTSREHK